MPIPIVYCDACGIVPVPADQLPVLLPELEDYKPTDDGKSPLARDPDFVSTTCPRCGGPARRETDTMDTFVCSSWYHFRYPSPHDDEAAFDRAAVDYWLPVDLYVGGAEHAVMHLLYARFFCKVLYDADYVGFTEPYATLRNQGMILAEGGQKMSKSKGNVVTPDSVVERYGADSLRLYELFIAPFEQAVAWNDRGVQGCLRFLSRFWSFALGVAELDADASPVGAAGGDGDGADARRVMRTLHKTVRKVTGDLQDFRFNTAVAALMEALNEVLDVWNERRDRLDAVQWHEVAMAFTLLLAPMTPHIAEEVWERLGHEGSVVDARWPALGREPGGRRGRHRGGAGQRQASRPPRGAGRRGARRRAVARARRVQHRTVPRGQAGRQRGLRARQARQLRGQVGGRRGGRPAAACQCPPSGPRIANPSRPSGG